MIMVDHDHFYSFARNESLYKLYVMWKSLEDEIEQLYNKIEEQKKLYALALKMKTDSDTLQSIKTKISDLRNNLQRLYSLYNGS